MSNSLNTSQKMSSPQKADGRQFKNDRSLIDSSFSGESDIEIYNEEDLEKIVMK